MDLSSLNDKQLEAVTAPLGPVLVLAGAGSGKTRVLTFRIAYIIEQGLVASENILALTFTNKAAKEMQSRVQKLLNDRRGPAAPHPHGPAQLHSRLPWGSPSRVTPPTPTLTGMPTLGTFHSIGAKLLRKEIHRLGYGPGFTILDSDDQLKVIREVAEDAGIGKKFAPTLFRAYISSAKNLLQTPDELNLGLDTGMQDMVYRVYASYQNFLFKQNSVDFDDLLMLPLKIFQVAPEVLKKYQEVFQYILVDEYQDTNQAQYLFLHLLASHRNLFVVGDDAQSIYGFRGSNIGNILNFEKDYPEAKVIKLEQNYRSTKNILAVAQNVIELNKEQKPKTLWTNNAQGKKIIIEEAQDGRTEAMFVAKQIVRLATAGEEEISYESEPEETQSFSILDQFLKKQKGSFGGRAGFGLPQLPKDHDSLNQFAVLYRTHAQSRELEEVFIQSGIPYQIVGGVKFYERKEIKDVLAYLRLLLNFRDLVSLKRVINEPARGIGPKAYTTVKQFVLGYKDSEREAAAKAKTNDPSSDNSRQDLLRFRQAIKDIGLPPKQKAGVEEFFGIIDQLAAIDASATLTEMLRLVYKITKIEDWLRDGTETGDMRVENIRELFNVTVKFNNMPWREGLEQFLEEVALVTEIDNLEDERDAVTLMTLHSAKGLEFDIVFFVGLEEGLLPHSQSLFDPSELAEEIRLAYVGLTRARKELFLLYARSRRVFGNFQANLPSRILRALPPESVDARVSGGNLWNNDTEVTYEPIDF